MINKSVFEDDLIAGMQRELNPIQKNASSDNLKQAVDYLHSAVEIFEEAGMTAKADQVLRIIGKLALAAENKVRSMPSLKALMSAGVTQADLKNINDPFSKARVNTALRILGYTDNEIKHFLGDKFMSEEDADDILNPERPYQKIMDWIKNPNAPTDPNNLEPGDEISIQSLACDEHDAKAPHKPKNPTKVSDSHTKGLTSEKMVSNLKEHGTVFNMADDGFADDLLDADFDAVEQELQGNPGDKTFEDEE